jgi:hypothetical protein
MDEKERNFHESNKPHWASDGSLIYALPSMSSTGTDRSDHTSGILIETRKPVVSEGNDVHFAKFAIDCEVSPCSQVGRVRWRG